MTIDPLRDEIAILKTTFPELELARSQISEAHFNFMLRSMALAYRAGKEHALASVQAKAGKA